MEQILTDREVAGILKLGKVNSWKTVQKLAREGRIRGQKIAGKWRFHPSAVEDFLMIGNRRRGQ